MIGGIVGQHGVPGRKESGEQLLEMCPKQKLEVGNSLFRKKDLYKYTLFRMVERRNGGLCIVTKTNAWKTCESV